MKVGIWESERIKENVFLVFLLYIQKNRLKYLKNGRNTDCPFVMPQVNILRIKVQYMKGKRYSVTCYDMLWSELDFKPCAHISTGAVCCACCSLRLLLKEIQCCKKCFLLSWFLSFVHICYMFQIINQMLILDKDNLIFWNYGFI